VFQASEGGSVSVGRRKFQSKTGATPTPAPLSRLEAAPRPMRGYGTDRISRIAGMTPISSPAPLSREVVLSKTSLAGICLITFACGIVTTVMVDRARSRAGDQVAAREADPSLTRTATEPAPIASPPAATAPVTPTVLAPSAAADPVVVQMPNLEASKARAIHAVPVVPARPRPVEAPVFAPRSKPPAAVAPPAVALETKVAPAAIAPVISRAKPAPAVVAPAKAKPAVVATAAPLPIKAKAALAPAPTKATLATSTVAKPKVATVPASPRTSTAAKAPVNPKKTLTSPKAPAAAKKTKPAGDSSDPTNGWVDPFTL
jgi:hypothetical protein